MFSTIKYTSWYGTQPDLRLEGLNLEILEKLIALCDSTWLMDRSAESKSLMKLGIVTLRKGYRIERYPLLELLFFKMPPVLFSNHKYKCTTFRREGIRHERPLQFLYALVKQYYKQIKHIDL